MSAQPRIVLHWLEQSRSHRILWLLHELKLPYELKIYKRDPQTLRADPALFKVHPLGKSPVVEVDGKVLAESGLICEYLVSKFGQDSELKPASEEEEWGIKYCLHHAEGTFMGPLVVSLLTKQAPKSAPYLAKPFVGAVMDKLDSAYSRPNIKLNMDFLEGKLKDNGTGYFVGNHLSAADIIYIYPVSRGIKLVTESDYPEINKWLELVSKRPAYIAANQDISSEDLNPTLF